MLLNSEHTVLVFGKECGKPSSTKASKLFDAIKLFNKEEDSAYTPINKSREIRPSKEAITIQSHLVMCCCQKTPTHSFHRPFFFLLNNGGQGQVPCLSVIGAGIGGVNSAKAWEPSQAQAPSVLRINAHQQEQSLSWDLKGDTSLLTRLLKTSPDQYKHLFIPISSQGLKAWRQNCKSGHSHLGKWGQRRQSGCESSPWS